MIKTWHFRALTHLLSEKKKQRRIITDLSAGVTAGHWPPFTFVCDKHWIHVALVSTDSLPDVDPPEKTVRSGRSQLFSVHSSAVFETWTNQKNC